MYDQSKLLEILKRSEYKCVDENGKCFPPSHTIYLKISEEMKTLNSHIHSKH